MDLMKMNLLPYVCAWAVLGVIVMVLALLRRKIADKEDDSLKLSDGETAHVAKQEQLAKKLAKIELWGKSATLVLIVTGVVLGLLYGWQMWEASSTAGLH
jgi:cytochrome b subunit of formate dehydrogenase